MRMTIARFTVTLAGPSKPAPTAKAPSRSSPPSKTRKFNGRHYLLLGLHPLQGDLKGYYALWVSGNWRVTFRFDGRDVTDVNYLDYH